MDTSILSDPNFQTNIVAQFLAAGLISTAKYAGEKLIDIFKDINKKGEKDVLLDDILKKEQSYDVLRIAFKFLKDEEGIPDKTVFDILKALLIKYWWLKENNDKKAEDALQFAEIAKTLEPNEIRVLFGAYEIYLSKKNLHNVDDLHLWNESIKEIAGFTHHELIELARDRLEEKKLAGEVTKVQPGTRSEFLSGKEYYGLTGLGISFCSYIYEDVKDQVQTSTTS